MLTRLNLQREGKILVANIEVMPRRRRATRPQSPPKVSIPAELEAPQVLPSVEIEEVQAVPEAKLESKSIMFGERETEGLSEEEEFKKYVYDLTNMVRVLYEERNTRMVGESCKSPHGEESSEDKKDENKDSKGTKGKPPRSPPSSQSSSSSQTIFHFHHKNYSYSFKNPKRKNFLTQIGH